VFVVLFCRSHKKSELCGRKEIDVRRDNQDRVKGRNNESSETKSIIIKYYQTTSDSGRVKINVCLHRTALIIKTSEMGRRVCWRLFTLHYALFAVLEVTFCACREREWKK
jgi:hypothetical protein